MEKPKDDETQCVLELDGVGEGEGLLFSGVEEDEQVGGVRRRKRGRKERVKAEEKDVYGRRGCIAGSLGVRGRRNSKLQSTYVQHAGRKREREREREREKSVLGTG